MPATTVETLIYRLEAEDKASKKFDSVNKKISASHIALTGLEKAFKSMTKTIAGFAIEAGRNFAQYEDTLSHARRTMSLTRQETLDLGQSLMDLSVDFSKGGLAAGVASDELAKIAGILGQLGFNARDNAEQFNQLVATIAKVGVAFGMTNQKAAEGLGILKNLYDLPIEQISNAASSIAHLGNTTVATSSQIIDIMTRMGGIAGILGVASHEAAGIAATLREAGVRTQVAGTSMSQIFSKLASDVDKFGEVLKKGGVSGEMLRMAIESGRATDALKMVLQGIQTINATEGRIAAIQALKDLGLRGVRTQQTLLALSNNLQGLNDNLAASEQAFEENVAVNEAYEAAIDNTAKKWTQFKNIIDVITKIIGKDLSLSFSDFLEFHLIPFTRRVKEWLETSKGAEAIFGSNGLIAQGFQFLGGILDEHQDKIFEWLDILDDTIPQTIDNLKKAITAFLESGEMKKAWEETKAYLKELGEAVETVIEWIGKADRALKDFGQAWRETIKSLGGPMKIAGETIEETYKDIAGAAEFVGHFFDAMDESAANNRKKLDDLARSIGLIRDEGKKMGDEFLYQSYLPDMAEATLKVTRKAIKMGDAYAESTGRMRDIYRTGHSTFSNLKRDVEDYHQVFERSSWDTKLSVDAVQFSLNQTADTVKYLGQAYEETGQVAVESAEKALTAWDLAMIKQQENVTALQQRISAGLAQAGPALAAMGASEISGLLGTGVLSSAGLLGAAQAGRMTPQVTPVAGSLAGGLTPGYGDVPPMKVTLMMDNQQVATMNAVLDDQKQQQNRRSFGGGSGGFGRSRGGW